MTGTKLKQRKRVEENTFKLRYSDHLTTLTTLLVTWEELCSVHVLLATPTSRLLTPVNPYGLASSNNCV